MSRGVGNRIQHKAARGLLVDWKEMSTFPRVLEASSWQEQFRTSYFGAQRSLARSFPGSLTASAAASINRKKLNELRWGMSQSWYKICAESARSPSILPRPPSYLLKNTSRSYPKASAPSSSSSSFILSARAVVAVLRVGSEGAPLHSSVPSSSTTISASPVIAHGRTPISPSTASIFCASSRSSCALSPPPSPSPSPAPLGADALNLRTTFLRSG